MSVGPPPKAGELDPLVVQVPEGIVLFRVHAAERRANEFNPGKGAPSRFAPLLVGDPPKAVPTLYASSSISGAFSESIFHDVPSRGPAKRILFSRLSGLVLSGVALQRDVHLAQLAGLGLRRIGVTRRVLIEGGPRSYRDTVQWAVALHDSPSTPEGLVWTSRQDDTARAVLLFGDRVLSRDLLAIAGPIALDLSPGIDMVEQAASAAGIAIVR